jgi:6-phosphofructokinase
MGSLAVEVLMQGQTNRAICIQNNHYVDMDITEALAMPYQFNKDVTALRWNYRSELRFHCRDGEQK